MNFTIYKLDNVSFPIPRNYPPHPPDPTPKHPARPPAPPVPPGASVREAGWRRVRRVGGQQQGVTSVVPVGPGHSVIKQVKPLVLLLLRKRFYS